MSDARRSTAIHEAAHAVLSFLCDMPLMHVAIIDDTHGETVPDCAACQTCWAYYEKHDPAVSKHARRIQHDLRCQAAIAIAGEIAENEGLVPTPSTPEELEGDREKARDRASRIHLWNSRCSQSTACATCDEFLNALKTVVRGVFRDPSTRKAVLALGDLLVRETRLPADEVTNVLLAQGLRLGSMAGSLPR